MQLLILRDPRLCRTLQDQNVRPLGAQYLLSARQAPNNKKPGAKPGSIGWVLSRYRSGAPLDHLRAQATLMALALGLHFAVTEPSLTVSWSASLAAPPLTQ